MWNSCCILRNGSCAFLDNLHTTYKVATFILPFSDEETEASKAFLRPGIYLQKSQYLTGNWDNDTHGMSVHKWYGSTELEEFWQRSKCQVFFTHCFPWKCNCEDSVSPMFLCFWKVQAYVRFSECQPFSFHKKMPCSLEALPSSHLSHTEFLESQRDPAILAWRFL